MVRSGEPFSRYADGMNVNVEGLRSPCEGEAVSDREGVAGVEKVGFGGIAGVP